MTEDIRKLGRAEAIPYELLLLADETVQAIDKYIHDSDIYVLEQDGKMTGVYVLYKLDEHAVEIKNVAVREELQGRGIGKLLLQHAEARAREKGFRDILIGTPDSAVIQLRLYQKAGFVISGIKKDFFIINYPEPIIEDGIQLKDMVILKKVLG